MVEVSDAARDLLVEQGYDPVYGARPLKRFLQRELETRIGRKLIQGDVPDGSAVIVGVERGELSVEARAPAAAGGAVGD